MTAQIQISDAELKEIAAGWPAEFRVYAVENRSIRGRIPSPVAAPFETPDP
jgi:hypothetical protein